MIEKMQRLDAIKCSDQNYLRLARSRNGRQMRLENKVAIVTGGSRGIGRATAELFAEQGAKVYVLDLSLDDAFTNLDITFMAHDVTDGVAWEKVVGLIIKEAGQIDILFNNAGIVGSYEGIETIELTDWSKILDINLNGVFLGTRAVLPHMRAAGRGSIVHTSSMWGVVGAIGVAAYTASKGAVRSLSKNVALTYAPDGIRSNSIHPGIIETPLVIGQDKSITREIVDKTPLGRIGTAREVAFGALFLASDESSYVTGTELIIDGGHTAQ
jgi:NAD(P)-dependent dehydrogenase (short-subunit alcohol dehydrogenase family)